MRVKTSADDLYPPSSPAGKLEMSANQNQSLHLPFLCTCIFKINKQNVLWEFLALLDVKETFVYFAIFMVTTHIFLLLGLSFLKGDQIAKGCSYMHWIHHHQNKHRSCHPPGDPLGCPIKEVSEFVEKINGLSLRPNNHPSGIKIQRFRPTYL